MDAIGGSGKAQETLSQFFARILDQLTLSAWLPAGALVLLSTYVIQLGAVTREGPALSVIDSLRRAARSIGQISLGGGLLLFAAVVLFTMVTQAFAFEAIRVFEGYWGTSRAIEWIADRRCNYFRRKLKQLETKIERINDTAWQWIEKGLAEERKAQIMRGEPVEITEDMAFILEAQFKGNLAHRGPTAEEARVLDRFMDSGEWEANVPPHLIRRLNNATKHLRDFPVERNVLPTRLGNVLRHYEDDTSIQVIESYVEEHFDRLPASLQITHDQRRSRLDLYCAMVVVISLTTTLAVGVLWGVDQYALIAAGLGVAGVSLNYRAAVASARAYGSVLVALVKWAEANDTRVQREQQWPAVAP